MAQTPGPIGHMRSEVRGRHSASAQLDSSIGDRHLRVLYVAEAFGGGVYELVRTQANALAARGHAVGVAYGLRPETPADVRKDFREDVELFPLPWHARTLGAQIRTARVLRPLAREWRPDVVHLYSSFAGLLGSLVLARELKTVYSPQAYAFTMGSMPRYRQFAYVAVERLVAWRVDRVVAASASEARVAQRELGIHNIDIVENGIPELDERPGARSDRAVKRVIAIGRLRPQRQPEACARILGPVKDVAEVKWIGGGDRHGPEAVALERAGVPVTGWLDREGVLAELGSATAYLHWTGWDGLALSVLEAMARDVVVVASDIGPNREALGPEQVCATEEGASELLRRVVQDRELRHSFLTSQRARRERYSANQMVDRWLALYGQLTCASQQP